MKYNYYFEVIAYKSYPVGYDSFSMFRWMNVMTRNSKINVSLFYGIDDSPYLSDVYSRKNLIFSEEVEFTDGHGLLTNCERYLKFGYVFYLFLAVNFFF